MMDPKYIILIIAIVLFIYLVISYIIYSKMIRHGGFRNGGIVKQTDPFFAPSFDWFSKVVKEKVHIHGYDGTKLQGFYIPSYNEQSTLTAIILHGYSGQNTDMAIVAQTYSDLGFKILLPDLRGHGLSEGEFSTFGHYESYDLKKWIHFILRTYGETDQILLHGVSMGAATVILSSLHDLPSNVKMRVVDSPYARVAPVFIRKVKNPLAIIFLPGLSFLTYYWHHFSLMNINVAKAVKKSSIPTYFIHGMKDELCPYKQTLQMMESSPASDKDIYTVLDAKHALSYTLEKPKIDEWLSKIIVKIFDLKIKTKK